MPLKVHFSLSWSFKVPRFDHSPLSLLFASCSETPSYGWFKLQTAPAALSSSFSRFLVSA